MSFNECINNHFLMLKFRNISSWMPFFSRALYEYKMVQIASYLVWQWRFKVSTAQTHAWPLVWVARIFFVASWIVIVVGSLKELTCKELQVFNSTIHYRCVYTIRGTRYVVQSSPTCWPPASTTRQSTMPPLGSQLIQCARNLVLHLTWWHLHQPQSTLQLAAWWQHRPTVS